MPKWMKQICSDNIILSRKVRKFGKEEVVTSYAVFVSSLSGQKENSIQ